MASYEYGGVRDTFEEELNDSNDRPTQLINNLLGLWAVNLIAIGFPLCFRDRPTFHLSFSHQFFNWTLEYSDI
jgi:hypothetical protein